MEKPQFIHIRKTPGKPVSFSEPGKYVVFFHNLSGSLQFDIRAAGVDLVVLGLYAGKGRESFTLETVQRHVCGRSRSSLLVKGVFEGTSSFRYQGLIRIEKDAPKTHAYQKNQNILLSPGVFVSSKPDLEILSSDVYCTHGSTTGRFNKEDLFYVQSRGAGEDEAKQTLAWGFKQEIFTRLDQEGCPEESRSLAQTLI